MEDLKERLYKTLSTVFKHTEFKSDKQLEATLEIAKGQKNVLILMPTGAGKSLCYQLPSISLKCLAVVISPLIALIEDQVEFLKNLGVNVSTINSKLTLAQRNEVLSDLASTNPKTNILYLTPEMITSDKFIKILSDLYNRNKLGYVVVDEAHCISQWGHDFRPKYGQITKLTEKIPNLLIVAATATANTAVRADIVDNLKIKDNMHIVELSAYRNNLYYEIFDKDKLLGEDPIEDLLLFINKSLKGESKGNVPQGSGIIYCRSRDGCDDLASRLKRRGFTCESYHAGMNNKSRLQVQTQWMEGKFSVIIATISFGMGIDKKDVRFVVHWTLPSGIMAFYQESGRAGRDGLPAYCRLYYSHQERRSAEFIVANYAKTIKDEKRLKSLKQQLQCLINLCEDYKCRHKGILHYLGEQSFTTCKTQCDVCNVSRLRTLPRVNHSKIFKSNNKFKFGDLFFSCGDRKLKQESEEEEEDVSSVVKRQLELRRSISSKKKAVESDLVNNCENSSIPLILNVRGIKDLKKSTRINSVRQIAEVLGLNRSTTLGAQTSGSECFQPSVSVDCDAALIESKIVESSRILPNYFAGVVKSVRAIKEATKASQCYVIPK